MLFKESPSVTDEGVPVDRHNGFGHELMHFCVHDASVVIRVDAASTTQATCRAGSDAARCQTASRPATSVDGGVFLVGQREIPQCS